MLIGAQKKKFGEFYEAGRENGVFDPKTTLLLHLVAAMGHGCVPCMEHYLRECGKAGVTQEEIGAAQGIAMAVGAGKVNAQMREAEGRLR